MKNVFTLLVLSAFCLSCGGFMRGTTGATKGNLIKQVSVETGCPIENIKIIDMQRNAGNAAYSLDVCGKQMVYRQIGTVFLPNKEAEALINEMQQK